LIYPSEENAQQVMDALTEFGFGDAGIPQEYFTREGTAIHNYRFLGSCSLAAPCWIDAELNGIAALAARIGFAGCFSTSSVTS
jgi:hypothetical protein